MIASNHRKILAAQAIEARIADVRHRYGIVVEQRRHQRRPHPGILRLAFRRMKDCGIGRRDPVLQAALRVAFSRRRVGFVRRPLGKVGFQLGRQIHRRHAARHLAGVVSSHAIRQNHQPEIGIGENGILVMVPHDAGIGTNNDFERFTQ